MAVEGIIENTQPTNSTSDYVGENGSPVGIDVAIVRCIERYGKRIIEKIDGFILELMFLSWSSTGSEELRKKFYTSIVVVGGGMKFPGIVEFLETRVSKLISAPHQTGK